MAATGKVSAHVFTFSLLLTPAIVYTGYYYKFGPDDDAKAAAIRYKDPAGAATKAKTVEFFKKLSSQDPDIVSRVDQVLKGGSDSTKKREPVAPPTSVSSTPVAPSEKAELKYEAKAIRTRLTTKVAAKKAETEQPPPPPPPQQQQQQPSAPVPAPFPVVSSYSSYGLGALAAAALGAAFVLSGAGKNR